MRGRSEGLILWPRHSSDCKYVRMKVDRDQSRRCNERRVAGKCRRVVPECHKGRFLHRPLHKTHSSHEHARR